VEIAHGTGVIVVAGIGTISVVGPDGEGGTGVPSTPRTRPAGVRRAGIGVVSGVGGGGSGACFSVACSARCRREQPDPSAVAVTSKLIQMIVFIDFDRLPIIADSFCRWDAPHADRV
jgi:hypothetical protein